jgi:hypothetical protein
LGHILCSHFICVRHHQYDIPEGPSSNDDKDEEDDNDNNDDCDDDGDGGEDIKSPDIIKKVGDKV